MEMNGWRTLAKWINHEGEEARDIFTDNSPTPNDKFSNKSLLIKNLFLLGLPEIEIFAEL